MTGGSPALTGTIRSSNSAGVSYEPGVVDSSATREPSGAIRGVDCSRSGSSASTVRSPLATSTSTTPCRNAPPGPRVRQEAATVTASALIE